MPPDGEWIARSMQYGKSSAAARSATPRLPFPMTNGFPRSSANWRSENQAVARQRTEFPNPCRAMRPALLAVAARAELLDESEMRGLPAELDVSPGRQGDLVEEEHLSEVITET
jgi:hypothetical protein